MKTIIYKNQIAKRSISKFLIMLGSVLVLSACSDTKATATEEDEHGHDEEEGTKTEVILTEAQFKTVGVEMGEIEMRNMKTVIKANGTTTVPPQNRADISTLIGGTVQDIFVLEGTYVAKGKTLATLQNLEVAEMQEEYNSAVASIEYLELEYERQKKLSDENVNPRKVFQEVKSKLAVERAKAKAAKNKLQALNVSLSGNSSIVPIVAPISGYVGKISITKGAFAEAGTILFEVIDNSKMHLDLNIYEKDIDKVYVGQEVNFVLVNQGNKSINGKIFGINKSFSNESKAVTVHAEIDTKDTKDLISGMYVTANINIENQKVMAVPSDAVVRNGEKYYIYILDENAGGHDHDHDHEAETKEKHAEGDGHGHAKEDASHEGEEHNHDHEAKTTEKEDHKEIQFKAIEVVPGTTDLGYTEIKLIDKLPANAKVVKKGAFYLLAQSVGGGEHVH